MYCTQREPCIGYRCKKCHALVTVAKMSHIQQHTKKLISNNSTQNSFCEYHCVIYQRILIVCVFPPPRIVSVVYQTREERASCFRVMTGCLDMTEWLQGLLFIEHGHHFLIASLRLLHILVLYYIDWVNTQTHFETK